MVRHRFLGPIFVGSNPATSAKIARVEGYLGYLSGHEKTSQLNLGDKL